MTSFNDRHPLAVPFRPLQLVGLFAAFSVRALAEFAHLNAAARECVTEMGVRDKALPGAIARDAAAGGDTGRADFAVRGAIRSSWAVESRVVAEANAHREALRALLLRAFRDVENVPASWSMSVPLSSWEGVTMSGSELSVELFHHSLRGPVAFECLPSSLRALRLHMNYLTGGVAWTQLPASLAELALLQNQLSGPLDLTRLPAALTSLIVGVNRGFTGPVDLTQLPAKLSMLDCRTCGLSGALDLTLLPSSLSTLYCGMNTFSGSLDLTRLPDSLQVMRAHCNLFSGCIDLTRLPKALRILDVNSNQLCGSVDLSTLPMSLQELNLSRNQFIGPVPALDRLPPALSELVLDGNRFSGALPDLSRLPPSLRVLGLSGNLLAGEVCISRLPRTQVAVRLDRMPGLTGKLTDALPKCISIEGTGITVGSGCAVA
jgi:hypothetical protein